MIWIYFSETLFSFSIVLYVSRFLQRVLPRRLPDGRGRQGGGGRAVPRPPRHLLRPLPRPGVRCQLPRHSAPVSFFIEFFQQKNIYLK